MPHDPTLARPVCQLSPNIPPLSMETLRSGKYYATSTR
jgi:hypothetical protein